MKKILEKIGVIINLTLQFDLPRKQFVEILSENIDEANNPATVFKRSKNMYKGSVSQDAFKLRENHHVFDSSYNDAVVKGRITGNDHKTEVHVRVSGITLRNFAFFGGGLLFLLLTPITLRMEDSVAAIVAGVILPIGFMILPFHLSRTSARKMLHSFERELFYMMEKGQKD